jgi:hypothetical protein
MCAIKSLRAFGKIEQNRAQMGTKRVRFKYFQSIKRLSTLLLSSEPGYIND